MDTKIPHYQIYLEFDKLVRNSSLYQALDELFANRVHIVTKKVYNSQYKEYCLKGSSNFNCLTLNCIAFVSDLSFIF